MQRLSERARPRAVRIVAVVLAVLATGAAVQAYRLALVGAGFAAKNVCSAVFVSGRTLEAAVEDLRAYRSTPIDLARVTLDRDRRAAVGSLAGLARREAVYRDGLGCTLAIGTTAEALRQAGAPTPTPEPRAAPWPEGDADAAAAIDPALARTLDEAFAEADGAPPRRTRAVVCFGHQVEFRAVWSCKFAESGFKYAATRGLGPLPTQVKPARRVSSTRHPRPAHRDSRTQGIRQQSQ